MGTENNIIIAIQNYENFYRLPPRTAKLSMLAESSAGVLGWLKAGPIPPDPSIVSEENEKHFLEEVNKIVQKQIEEENIAYEYSRAQKLFAYHFEELYKLCKENSWGDPFSYARSREIHLANMLNHEVSQTLSGADAIDEDAIDEDAIDEEAE